VHDVFTELSALLAVGLVVSIVMRLLKQPLIVGHIFTGMLVGPVAFGLVKDTETIEVLGKFGITLLLFIVGLGLNPKVIKEVGKAAIITGTGQVFFTTAIGFAIVKALGYNNLTSLYVSVALAFSSTIIILKLLSDKKEQNKLYGKVTIGFLLVQDILATFALLIASASKGSGLSAIDFSILALKGVGIALLMYLVVLFVIKPSTTFLSKSQELLFLFAIAWGFGIATGLKLAGFSLEIGALFAGVALSSMPYAQEVSSRLRPLRDFFIIVFFISLGAGLNFGDIQSIIWQAIGLSTFVLIGNPLVVIILMGLLGYTKKNSFKAGLAVAQISEFSLIFIAIGLDNGQITEKVVSLVTLVGIITIAISAYMIIYSDSLFRYAEKYLSMFERSKAKFEQKESRQHYELVLFGYQHGGHEFVKVFKSLKKRYIVIDYDPAAIDDLERHHIDYLYGDATDVELLEELGLEKAKIIVSTITDHEVNKFLAALVERINPHAVLITHADTVAQAAELYELGAGYVMMPHYIGSEKIGAFIKRSGFKKSEFRKFRDKHLAYLQSHYTFSGEEPS